VEDVNVLVFLKVVSEFLVSLDKEIRFYGKRRGPESVTQMVRSDSDVRRVLQESLAQFAVRARAPLGVAEAGVPYGSCRYREITVEELARRINEV
jgi:hypothetical protein